MPKEASHMRKFLLPLLFAAALVAIADVGLGQQKPSQCEQGPNQPRNWELIGNDYVYFDYILCPADIKPPQPLVRIWITTQGDGVAVEKWAQGRDGADLISMFHGTKKAYTLYRDLDAIPLKVFKAESRKSVPAGMSKQPFLIEGSDIIPLENLTAESAEKVKKAFESADIIIKSAQRKVALYHETPKIEAILDALNKPLKAQK
jgi:hypothetical protein